MSATAEEKPMALSKTVEQISGRLNKDAGGWAKAIRQVGLERFRQVGIPTTKDEEWKYTNLADIQSKSFQELGSAPTPFDEIRRLCDPKEINIILVNGRIDESLSTFTKRPATGTTILPLAEALAKKEKLLAKLYASFDPARENAFIALNQALLENGVYIEVADQAIVPELIHILHVTSGSRVALTAPRSVIAVGRAAEATVLETHVSFEDGVYLAAPLTDVFIAENSTLHYCKAQSESLKSFHIGNTRVWQERNSHFDGFSFMNGAALTRNDLDIISNGEGTQSTLNGFYGLNGRQLADNHSSMDHRFPNCTSNQLYKGILNGQSHAVFNGKIFVRPIAQQTNSYQLNKNLIIGTDCRVDTKPQLEIFADDVKCTHGATIGQLNEDEIFYLQSRCIAKKTAVKLLAHGFIDDIINNLHNASVVKKLNILLEPTFAALE